MSRPRHARRRACGAPIVLTPTDALAVLVATRRLIGAGVVAALVLDTGFRPGELAVTVDDDDLDERTRLLLDLLAGDTAGVVMASRPPGGEPRPRAADARRFAALRAHGEACGTAVLDWFLLGERFAVSLAELTGADWRWPVPAP